MYPAVRPPPAFGSWAYGLELFVVFAAYFVAGEVGLAVPFTSGNVSPVWPAAGIALAAFLVVGYRAWPAIAAAAFVVNYLSSISVGAALAIAAGNTAGPAVGAWLVCRLPAFRPSLNRLNDVLGVILLAVPVGAAISATVGVTVLFVHHVDPWTRFDAAWLVWWLGDAIGALLVAPLVLALLYRKQTPDRRQVLELAVLCSVSLLTCFAIFDGTTVLGIEKDVFAFVALPLTLWGACRFDIRGAAGVTLLIAGVAIWETANGSGPFVRNTPLQNAMTLQVFVAVLSAWGLILAAAITESTHLIRQKAHRELEQTEQRYRAIVDTAHDGIWMLDDDLVTVFVNPSMATMLGYEVDEMRGRPLSDFVSEAAWLDRRECLRRPGAREGERAQAQYRRKNGSELLADVFRTRAFGDDGTFTGVLEMVSDTTNQRRAEGERQEALDRLVLLSKAVEQTADGVLISDSAGHIHYLNPAFERTTGFTREETASYTQGVVDARSGAGPRDQSLWSRVVAGEPYRGILVNRKKSGEQYWASLTVTPITDRATGRATHTVAVLTDVTDSRRYDEQEVRLRLARAVQQRFNQLPPLLPELDIAASSFPADETGGDYCDFVELPTGVLYVAIGDVAGHGFDAALIMALTRAYMRSFATLDMDVAEVLTRTNRALVGDLEGNRFVTMLLVRIDLRSGVMTYAGAGHVPGLLLDESGDVDSVMTSAGVPLGLFADAAFASRDVRLEAHQILVLSTDGVTETTNSDGLEFGGHRLIEAVRNHRDATAQDIAASLFVATQTFGGAERQRDDLTFVVVKVTHPTWGIEEPTVSSPVAVFASREV